MIYELLKMFNSDNMKLYVSALRHAIKLKVQQLCSSSVYEPNISILLCLSDSLQCSRGLHFLTWALYLSIGKR